MNGSLSSSIGRGHVRNPDGKVTSAAILVMLVSQPCYVCSETIPEGSHCTTMTPRGATSRRFICEVCRPWHIYDDRQDPPFVGPMPAVPCGICAWLSYNTENQRLCSHCHGTGREPIPEDDSAVTATTP